MQLVKHNVFIYRIVFKGYLITKVELVNIVYQVKEGGC
ncbi:MAG: hypothetical protein ACJA1A_001220 [Saprospiraceae bacterium]|jgi:hypothetical protein